MASYSDLVQCPCGARYDPAVAWAKRIVLNRDTTDTSSLRYRTLYRIPAGNCPMCADPKANAIGPACKEKPNG